VCSPEIPTDTVLVLSCHPGPRLLLTTDTCESIEPRNERETYKEKKMSHKLIESLSGETRRSS